MKLEIELENCFGISNLQHTFEFGTNPNENKSYAIYAPNGLMKTSFTKTFERISIGEVPEEERYSRRSVCKIIKDGNPIDIGSIYVLRSEIDISKDSDGVTDILVLPEKKVRYDQIILEIENEKANLISFLQKKSGVPKKDIEKKIIEDTGFPSIIEFVKFVKTSDFKKDLSAYPYHIIFDEKASVVLQNSDFLENAKKFNERYQEIFSEEGTIYYKGVFNPIKAETAFQALKKQGFFNGGHKVHMNGDESALNEQELDERIEKINKKIEEDKKLKQIKAQLSKNAQTQSLNDLIENLSVTDVDYLLAQINPLNINKFKKDIWNFYCKDSSEIEKYLVIFNSHKDEIEKIELEAAKAAPQWLEVVGKFNDRFVNMPFTLDIKNKQEAALGREKAKLSFIFNDGPDRREWNRNEVKTLSQGELRALYLLNFIFDVESRLKSGISTLFIIDDVADSFDYKNKHAIIQYLDDLNDKPGFHQIILTHNFDFLRTLANNFVHRDRCLMANRESNGISLTKAEGIKNYFNGVFKNKINTSKRILCATIPFTRNIIEYTKGEADANYLNLTYLLHWKEQTSSITVNDYLNIYNQVFGTQHAGDNQAVIDLIFNESLSICQSSHQNGLNLEDKILLSMAIRLKAENFMIEEIRLHENNPLYWCNSNNQFGVLIKKYARINPASKKLYTLEKVSITVSSNIHLNSFMYEPILDLTIDHLIKLYTEVCALVPTPVGSLAATETVAA